MAKHDKDATFVGDSRISAKRIPNIAPSYSEFPGKSEPFWPNFLLKEWMVAAVCLVGYLLLTVSHPSPLTDKANPNDTSFVPLPDWYFLFLYQMLKYPWASGDWVVFGTIIFPGVAFTALVVAPWLDAGKERRPNKRPIATGIMLLSLVGVFYLTWAAMDEHNRHHPSNGGHSAGGSTAPAAPAEKADPGFKADPLWTAQTSCIGCHGKDMEGVAAPNLQKVGSKYDATQIADIIKNGKGGMPGGMFQGSDEDLKKLAEYMASLK
ncbi:MAG TPA: c-type cytochrome [Candidatus Bathyarchaeia archaeon]|nr:c-type cytochrome [Candidatus Bathyarchaeia archaeon]